MSKQLLACDQKSINGQLQQIALRMSLLMEQSIILACASDWNGDDDPKNGWPPSQEDLLTVSSCLEGIYFDLARITGLDSWGILHLQQEEKIDAG